MDKTGAKKRRSPYNVFIVSVSAVNYRHEQKSLPKRYQSHTICPPFSLFWKVPVNAQHRAKWICTMSFVPFSTSYAAVVPGVPYRAISPNGAPFIPTSRDEASPAKTASASLRKR